MAFGQTGLVGFYSWGVAGCADVAPGYGGKKAFGQTRGRTPSLTLDDGRFPFRVGHDAHLLQGQRVFFAEFIRLGAI